MDSRVILVAAAVLFGFGLLLGFFGRSGNNEEVAAPCAPADPTTMTHPAELAR
ncbi:MAG TPA: hypothetical protein VGJ99_06315 [Actinomycetota bacterium]